MSYSRYGWDVWGLVPSPLTWRWGLVPSRLRTGRTGLLGLVAIVRLLDIIFDVFDGSVRTWGKKKCGTGRDGTGRVGTSPWTGLRTGRTKFLGIIAIIR